MAPLLLLLLLFDLNEIYNKFIIFFYIIIIVIIITVFFFSCAALLHGPLRWGRVYRGGMRAQELKIARNTKANMTNIVEQFSIPDGFADILKSFTREVLRDQPEDINAYAAEYFAALAAQQAPTSENEDLNIDMGGLRERIENMFVSADVEGKGYLNRTQFMEVMSTVQGELNMSDADLRHVMSEADENDDGMIDFNEFLPLALSIFEAIYAKQDLHKHEEEAVNKASDLLLHGMTRQELESMLHTLFNRADTEGKGYLDRQQFGKVLKDSDLGFTP